MNLEKILGRIEESAGEEVKQDSLDQIWYKFQTPSGEYYSPFIKRVFLYKLKGGG
jgi:hypothetical protein